MRGAIASYFILIFQITHSPHSHILSFLLRTIPTLPIHTNSTKSIASSPGHSHNIENVGVAWGRGYMKSTDQLFLSLIQSFLLLQDILIDTFILLQSHYELPLRLDPHQIELVHLMENIL